MNAAWDMAGMAPVGPRIITAAAETPATAASAAANTTGHIPRRGVAVGCRSARKRSSEGKAGLRKAAVVMVATWTLKFLTLDCRAAALALKS